jgi:hypothetical protein
MCAHLAAAGIITDARSRSRSRLTVLLQCAREGDKKEEGGEKTIVHTGGTWPDDRRAFNTDTDAVPAQLRVGRAWEE